MKEFFLTFSNRVLKIGAEIHRKFSVDYGDDALLHRDVYEKIAKLKIHGIVSETIVCKRS